ncbi:hypothetical protein RUM44_008985 [Polyplax serrata]|uniref:Uncharacterized protein n=1 Tax=Polyplax serrata TaxID=468196 RepID=A0ABR1ARF2_POLSC
MSDEPSEKNAEEKEQENGSEERSSDAAISEPSFNQLKLTETLRKKLVYKYSAAQRFEKNPTEMILKNWFVMAPMRHHEPRGPLAAPCQDQEESSISNGTVPVSTTTSSFQLLEVGMLSPVPSDEDLNLLSATYSRKLRKMMEAIENGANVNTIRDGQSPLLLATDIADERLVRFLLSVPNINLDIQNLYGLTPLAIAVKHCSDEIVRLLLNYNADVNIMDNMGRTPLHEALFQQRPNIVKLLLAFGADCDITDVFGERPMYTACVKKPNVECLNLLLNFGATPEYTNIFGMTLLSRAILNFTEFEIIKTLVRNGASVNTVDVNTGKAPLHYAALINDVRITKFLLAQGASTSIRTFHGFTPYEEAIFHKSSEVAECLFLTTQNASIKRLNSVRHMHFAA